MNIKDTKKIIFSFLRKEPKLVCSQCNRILIWNKQFIHYYEKPYKNSFIFICQKCYFKEIGYPDFFTCVVLGIFIYTLILILNNL